MATVRDAWDAIEAVSVINDLNVAMTWLRYPGRVNGTATAAQVDFGVAGATPSTAPQLER